MKNLILGLFCTAALLMSQTTDSNIRQLATVTYSQLVTPSSGTGLVKCSNCTVASPTMSGGTGAYVVYNSTLSEWDAIGSGGGSGTVTSITAGQCLSGGTITTSGTIALAGGINPQTATYQVLAGDFSACKTITVASGTFTITLVASGSQPPNGQYINILNYGSGVVTVARSGQNINGGTTSVTLAAGSATAPTSATIWSDGTNYFAEVPGSGSGSGGGAVFAGSASPAPTFSATPTFSLAAVSSQSPVRIEPGVMTANVTAVTFTNVTAGAKFSIAWTQAATGGPYTVTYGSPVVNPCQISQTASVVTTQEFEVGNDGATIKGVNCTSTEAGILRGPNATMPVSPATGQFSANADPVTGLMDFLVNIGGVTTESFSTTGGGGGGGGSGPANVTVAITGATQNAGTCSSPATVAMSGLTTAMVPVWGYTANPSSLTGWGTTAGMTFQPWVSAANTMSYILCNPTSANLTYTSVNIKLGANPGGSGGGGGGIAIVQSVTSQSSGATAVTTQASGSFTQTAGHALVVPVNWFSATGGDTVTCTDTLSDSFTSYATELNTTGGTGTATSFCVAFSVAGGSNIVTVTSNGGARSYLTLSPVEISGAVSVDTTAVASSGGTSGTSASTNLTTSVGSDIIFTTMGNDVGITGISVTGYTVFQSGTQTKGFYDLVSGAAAYTQSWAWTTSARSAISTIAIEP